MKRLSLVAVMLAVGCGSAPHASTTRTAAENHPGASANDTRQRPTVATSGGDGSDATCNVAPVYFAFDSADLSTQARDTLVRNAQCVQRNADAPIELVGATDPRGTEEYNLALGDQRARAVARYLEALGVPERRVRVTSVGEEEARGTDERSWAEDRYVKRQSGSR